MAIPESPQHDDDILVLRDLSKRFRGRANAEPVRAVDGVSFALRRGETLGLVGESGCGKSTLSRVVLGAYPTSSGEAWFNAGNSEEPDWVELTRLSRRRWRRYRSAVQMIFQDPYASLNPRMTVGRIIAEPLEIHTSGNPREVQRRVQTLMEEVGLDPKLIKRFPHEFSGGQRQRIGIARALALDPRLLICDEPVSALDVSIRSQVLNLFLELQQRRGLTYLFISHDLSVVKRMSHRVAVMYLGRIVELATADQIYSDARHPYTRALLEAIPIPDPELVRHSHERVRGEAALSASVGCPFAPRCPEVFDDCRSLSPPLGPPDGSHQAACLLAFDPRRSSHQS